MMKADTIRFMAHEATVRLERVDKVATARKDDRKVREQLMRDIESLRRFLHKLIDC